MPSLSRSLEQALHRAIKLASERHHEYATLEHLLLALIDDPDAAQVMKACNVDLDAAGNAAKNMSTKNLRRWSSRTARTPSPPPASSASCSARSCMSRIPAATK